MRTTQKMQFPTKSMIIEYCKRKYCQWGIKMEYDDKVYGRGSSLNLGSPSPLWVNPSKAFFKCFFISNFISSCIFVLMFVILTIINGSSEADDNLFETGLNLTVLKPRIIAEYEKIYNNITTIADYQNNSTSEANSNTPATSNTTTSTNDSQTNQASNSTNTTGGNNSRLLIGSIRFVQSNDQNETSNDQANDTSPDTTDSNKTLESNSTNTTSENTTSQNTNNTQVKPSNTTNTTQNASSGLTLEERIASFQIKEDGN